jgi:hypothetical protein
MPDSASAAAAMAAFAAAVRSILPPNIELQENADGSFTVFPDHSALFLEVLPVLLANAAAMRAVGERTVGVPRGPVLLHVDPDALPEAVAHALSNAAAASDAARARAMLACVSRDAARAADAASPASQRHGDAARAVTCSGIAAALRLLGALIVLRFCEYGSADERLSAPHLLMMMPPPATLEAADTAGAQPSSAADAWQQLSRHVQTSMAVLQGMLSRDVTALPLADDWIPELVDDYTPEAPVALLQLIGATEAEVAAAEAELDAIPDNDD